MARQGDHFEVEVKFWVAEHTAVRQHLLSPGGHPQQTARF